MSDEGSTNGTFLNGELVVRPTLMTADDELRAGLYVLRVQPLMGSASTFSPPVRDDRAQLIDPPLSAKARPIAEGPRPKEHPTDLQISQRIAAPASCRRSTLGCACSPSSVTGSLSSPGSTSNGYSARLETQPDLNQTINRTTSMPFSVPTAKRWPAGSSARGGRGGR